MYRGGGQKGHCVSQGLQPQATQQRLLPGAQSDEDAHFTGPNDLCTKITKEFKFTSSV